jgi:two-component system NtrC family sensor kinase
VFSNLLRNAAAAMDEKGHIRVSSEHRGEDIVLEVRDNGRGMPASQVQDLFNPTFHINEARVATTN